MDAQRKERGRVAEAKRRKLPIGEYIDKAQVPKYRLSILKLAEA